MAFEPYFIGCSHPIETSKIVITGYPYDGTSSYRPGSRFAPHSIREASYALETYSHYQQLDLEDKYIHDEGDISLPFGDKSRILHLIQENTKKLLKSDKKILSLGGEHLITYPIIKEYIKIFSELVIIHFDAHLDMRDDYLGEKESHATVLRRVYDLVGDKKIYHCGVRSGTREEFRFAKEHCHLYPFSLNQLKDAFINISDDKPIYITVDLDVLDPSIFPGTGTPEPGGVLFHELLEAFYLLKNKNIIGCDVVELSPDYDSSNISSAAAGKVIRELLLML